MIIIKIPKIFLMIVIFIILGAIISCGYDKLYSTYDILNREVKIAGAEFESSNIKINSEINTDLDKEGLQKILLRISHIFDKNGNYTVFKENWRKAKKEICISINLKNIKLSMKGIKENTKEFYIAVDINIDKKYNQSFNYNKVYSILKDYSSNTDAYVCFVGKFTKKLQYHKCNDILSKILYNMSANKIHMIKDKDMVSLVAYSKELNNGELNYAGEKINLNVALRYKEDLNKTYIYIASPIIKLDY